MTRTMYVNASLTSYNLAYLTLYSNTRYNAVTASKSLWFSSLINAEMFLSANGYELKHKLY